MAFNLPGDAIIGLIRTCFNGVAQAGQGVSSGSSSAFIAHRFKTVPTTFVDPGITVC